MTSVFVRTRRSKSRHGATYQTSEDIALPPAPVPTPPWAVIDELAMSNSTPRHVGLSVVPAAGSGFFVVSPAPAPPPPPACTTCVRARACGRGGLGVRVGVGVGVGVCFCSSRCLHEVLKERRRWWQSFLSLCVWVGGCGARARTRACAVARLCGCVSVFCVRPISRALEGLVLVRGCGWG